VQLPLVHGLPSSQPGVPLPLQVPPAQASTNVQGLLSSHGTVLATNLQPLAGSQLSVVHNLLSLQVVGLPPVQAPPAQASPLVHGLLSLQVAVVGKYSQPLPALQLSLVHGLLSLHWIVPVPLQVPLPQTSDGVQGSWSSQAATLLLKVQPVPAVQLSEVHGLLSWQVGLPCPLQAPSKQVSVTVHGSLSLQGAVLAEKTQPVVGLQLSLVQTLPSLQAVADPLWHLPLPHRSPAVQASPSEHGRALARNWQPVPVRQLSVVHGLSSVQSKLPAPTHSSCAHVSTAVQGSPSSQGPVRASWIQPLSVAHRSAVHGRLSLQSGVPSPTHSPSSQTSSKVQRLPSSQMSLLGSWTQPNTLLQLSVVHVVSSAQSTG
jgi:hypothetical protein